MKDSRDTIVAISTPPGEGGIGIVRLSGSEALAIGLKIFARKSERGQPFSLRKKFKPAARKLYYGYILDDQGNEIDEVLFSFMPGPYSYTCEDIVEINAHGGAVPLKRILELALEKGARIADPGEFTKRAYLNGRLDLVQAESVLALIRAKTDKALKAAIRSLQGALSGEIQKIRAEIIGILAQIEIEVDFAHEDADLEEEQDENIGERIECLQKKMAALLQKRFQGKVLQEGLKTVIIGRPNVGKSSLYNYLVREERAIVTEIPGTTRDLLMEYVNIKGIPLKLIDTAGLRLDGDKVEKIGMEFSRKAMQEADLLLFMLDAAQEITPEDSWIYEQISRDKGPRILIILNKIDLKRKLSKNKVQEIFPGNNVLEISLLHGVGLDKLEETISAMVFSGEAAAEESALLLEARQGELLHQALICVEEAREALENKFPPDLISIDLRQAQQYLGELVGEEIGTEVLDLIFQRFCVGK
ncbi:MAG: tRNA uridine-5-carboxymethylaminomethyl(34) synthesis GTPase MnmE [Dethiobacteria bacterium]